MGAIALAARNAHAAPRSGGAGAVPRNPRAAPRPDVDSLPRGAAGALIRAARAPTTWRKYDAQWAQFAGYCEAHGAQASAPTEQLVIGFLTDESARMRTGRAVEAKRAALRKSAEIRGYDCRVFDAPLVNELVHGAVRSKPSLPKPPVTFSGAAALRAAAATATPLDLEVAKTLFLVMLLGPWRLADALSMRNNLIDDIDGTLYCVLQPKEARGALEWRVIEPMDDAGLDPVRRIRALRRQPQVVHSGRLWLDRRGQPLTNAEARHLVQRYMLHIGLDPKWTPHQCRSAGASLMMLAGVSSPIIARHGGWTDVGNLWKFYCRTFAQDDVVHKVETYTFKTST